MKKSFSKLFLAPLSVLLLVSFALAPIAQARGGGGHGGGGGGHHAGGGGRAGGGRDMQVNNSRRDVRANHVRNTSVNHVNTNRNVNVDIDRRGGCCGDGWNENYHPVATAAAVTAGVAVTAAVVGSIVRSVPPNCSPYKYNGMVYQQCGSSWYQPQYVGNNVQYVVVNPPY